MFRSTLIFAYFFSLSLHVQSEVIDESAYADAETFEHTAFSIILRDFWRIEHKDSNAYNTSISRLDVLEASSDRSNDTTEVYRMYARLQMEHLFDSEHTEEIHDLFLRFYRTLDRTQIKTIVYPRALEYQLHYYRAVDRIEYLFDLIEVINATSHLLGEKDHNELLSNMYYQTFQFEKAIELYLNRYASITDPLAKASLLNNIGISYGHLDQQEQAVIYFKQSIAGINAILVDTVLIHQKTQEENPNYTRVALEDFKRSIIENLELIYNEPQTKEEKLTSLLNHARVDYLKKKVVNIDLLYDIAYTYTNLDQYEASNAYLDSIDNNYRRPIRHSNLKLKIKKLRLFNNLKLGNIDEALNNLTLDESTGNKSDRILADRRYQQKAFDKEKHIIKSDHFQNKVVVTLLFSAVLLVVSYLAFRIWKKKHLQQRKAEYRQKQMDSIKKKSELLLREADHRIMNSIQLVANMASLEKMKGEKEFDIEAFQLKMMSIAEIHKLMYKGRTEDVSTADYLNEIINLLKTSLSFRGDIVLTFNQGNLLNTDDLKNIGLILIELIINTIKHASVTQVNDIRIDITFTIKSPINWHIEYRDNGVFNYQTFKRESDYNTSVVAILIHSLSAGYQIQDLPHFNIKIYK